MASEGDRNVGGTSGIVVDENRGRKESRQGDKRGRGAPRDTVASLAKRMVGVETSTSELKEQVECISLRRELEDLRSDVSLCKRVMASGGGNTSNIAPKVEVPNPSLFMRKRETRAVDDFLWEMEQYMDGVNIVDDASKIKTATRYLKDTTALWWRR
ncbi:hypothetical protein Tco_0894889 [Tanacetum coccineum]|uniref:Uncharacterized protein n=1 Tax=Tanacetum coccineum TaxID=301880 RepID=A0ABQ5CEG2_9ASTR